MIIFTLSGNSAPEVKLADGIYFSVVILRTTFSGISLNAGHRGWINIFASFIYHEPHNMA